MNIDKEWENFISSGYNDDISEDENDYNEENINNILKINEEFISSNISSEILPFCKNGQRRSK